MRHSTLMAAATAASLAHAAPTAAPTSLTEMCTVSNVQAALPKNGTLEGIFLIPSSVSAQAVYNSSTSTSFFKKRQVAGGGSTTTTGIYNYCNVTATYTHGNDSVVVWYGFPEPSQFENRFYVGGGAGYALSSAGVTPGLEYGAVTGCTDAGYDAFENSLDAVVLNDDNSINWQNVKMFSYQALGEMTQIGKHMTTQLYGIKKGCSDGGRQGQSQVQNYGDVYDGIITGAPAFRQGQQQTLHVYPAVVEQTQDYYPTTCAIDKIVNATIAACDPLDGRTDGVLSRTDLCMLNFNLSSIIGESYYCAAVNSTSLGYNFGKRDVNTGATSSYTPAQNGTVNAKDIAVVQQVYDGVFNSKGQRAYLSWQIGANPADADTIYNSTTGQYTYDIPSTGGVFVTKFLEQVDLDNLANIDGVTYDTIVGWMKEDYQP
ncbi:tannase protein [Rutstroemia sp. NJR-2017a BBW]|nr:tannase protein [Rutstroemia sp. NJR-2017a BBW]